MPLALSFHALLFDLAIGAKASIEEIRLESTSLQLCHSCQEIIERQKHPLGLAAKISLPKPNDRVNRVLRFMDNYLDRQDVQISGLDAVLKYARNADAKATVRTTDAVAVVSKAAKQHKDSAAVVWRSCLSLSLLAALSSEVSVDVASTNLHDELIGAYPKFMKEPVVQVQIMRLYAALLQWPKSHRMVHKSQAAVDFLKTVAEEVEKAKKKFEEDLREKERLAMLALKMGGPKAKRKAAYVAVTSPPESPRGATAGPAAVEPQQMLPLPVQVVRFVRESGGKAYKEKSGKVSFQSQVITILMRGAVEGTDATKGTQAAAQLRRAAQVRHGGGPPLRRRQRRPRSAVRRGRRRQPEAKSSGLGGSPSIRRKARPPVARPCELSL